MNQKKKRWTTAEDSIVVAQVRKFPTNLTHAFKEAAKETDRTASACAYRWYSKLSKDSSNACFITISGKHKSLNRKNGEGTKCSQSLFTKILKLLNIIK
jgi:hypothetical protein